MVSVTVGTNSSSVPRETNGKWCASPIVKDQRTGLLRRAHDRVLSRPKGSVLAEYFDPYYCRHVFRIRRTRSRTATKCISGKNYCNCAKHWVRSEQRRAAQKGKLPITRIRRGRPTIKKKSVALYTRTEDRNQCRKCADSTQTRASWQIFHSLL